MSSNALSASFYRSDAYFLLLTIVLYCAICDAFVGAWLLTDWTEPHCNLSDECLSYISVSKMPCDICQWIKSRVLYCINSRTVVMRCRRCDSRSRSRRPSRGRHQHRSKDRQRRPQPNSRRRDSGRSRSSVLKFTTK
jgi:hypothetical protein